MRPQPIWKEGVIPAAPDAWVWLGDMAYTDTSPVGCSLPDTASLPYCNCSAGWMAYPGQCAAGDVDAARERWVTAVHHPDYRAFLDFMCPPGPAAGQWPPAGTDPAVCPRPIFGVYDDHDYGWNNGNRRLPRKGQYKAMFLDAVGEARDSPRRGEDAGLQAGVTLNGGGPGRDIDLILLDGRWYRDPLPCDMRRTWCEDTVLPNPAHNMRAWCVDYLYDDGATGRGSCCTKDADLAAWCAQPASRADPLWPAACDPTTAAWGRTPLVLGPDNATLLAPAEGDWEQPERLGQLWHRLLQARDSPVCEVLGAAQRSWLASRLAASTAALTLVASGSVALGSVGWQDPVTGYCSGDDWNCYGPAQANFLHTLANATSGCVVVLAGDYHYGDIKVARGGNDTAYAARLQTANLRKPVYQLMSSGLTASTAHHAAQPCTGTFREDLVGLRPLGPCAVVDTPNFGMVEVDWARRVAHLTLRDAVGGGVAAAADGTPQHIALDLDTCQQVPSA